MSLKPLAFVILSAVLLLPSAGATQALTLTVDRTDIIVPLPPNGPGKHSCGCHGCCCYNCHCGDRDTPRPNIHCQDN